MRMFGKNIVFNEDEIVVDTLEDGLVGSSYGNEVAALSTLGDKAINDKAEPGWKDKAGLDARKTLICDDFIEDFALLSKVCLIRNREADIYDVFETIRTKFLGGWGYTKEYTNKLDAEIEMEYQKECLKKISIRN